MRNLFVLLAAVSLSVPVMTHAQNRNGTQQRQATGAREKQLRNQLSSALKLAQSGQYANAANNLFSLGRRPELAAERPQIKYILGTMLMELKLYQTAAFQFVDVIRTNNSKYTKLSVEKLSTVADILGDDTILNYAISRVDVNDISSQQKDMVFYRMGEIKQRNKDFAKAAEFYSRVSPNSTYYYQAVYRKALAELESNNVPAGLSTLKKMLDARSNAPVTDTNRVEAQLGIARALYQKQDWEGAIEAYSNVPRDTVMWHDAVFEQTWAMLRAARFRSALSNFQTLHSAYYEDFYMPESLLLRSIVYLYICKYDEMEKVLSLFENTYGPIRVKIGDFVKQAHDANDYYVEVQKAYVQRIKDKKSNLRLPYIVSKSVLNQGDVKRSMFYLERLAAEKAKIEGSASFKASALGQYALKIIANRSKNTKFAIGDMVKAHLLNMRIELRDLYEQAGFIRYEMINGRKESVKKKIAGRDLGAQIDDSIDRKFYIENGYQYYPFQGEFWLDEVGNYHYLGKQSCE